MSVQIAKLGVDIARKAVRPTSGGLVVYSAVIGCYDDPPVVRYSQPQEVHLVCISDRPIENPGPWEVIIVDREPISERAQAKVYKLFPHVLFPNMEASIWVDGTFEIIGNMRRLADKALNTGCSMAVFQHPARRCAYSEARACRRLKKESSIRIEQQMARYKNEGFSRNMGLLFGGVLIRKHSNKFVVQAMESWWQEVNKFSMRDQLSFNYVAWKENLSVEILKESIDNNQYLKRTSHKHPAVPEKTDLRYEFWRIVYRVDNALRRASRKLLSHWYSEFISMKRKHKPYEKNDQ